MVSFVAPCYDEADVLPLFIGRLTSHLDQLAANYRIEVILVDDGSRDRSWDLIKQAAAADPRYRGVKLSRNFGQQAALTCGYEFAEGDAVVTLDADLQDPPEVVHEMISRWRAGADVVLAVRTARVNEPRTKLLTARLFYSLANMLCRGTIRRQVGEFRLLSRRSLDALLRLQERDRFIRGMVGWIGFQTAEVQFDRPGRPAGRTHYTFRMMARLAIDAFASAGRYPLELAATCILGVSALSVLYLLAHTVAWATGLTEGPGWLALLTAVTVLGATALAFQALTALYLGRLYEQVRQRPLYIVEEVVGRVLPRGSPGVKPPSTLPEERPAVCDGS